MKIIKIDKKINEIIVFPEILDDLWHLEKIIEKDDIVIGKTDRKIKPSKEGEKVIRETIFVHIQVENVHFQEFSENLRISGIIVDGKPKDLVELKAHHSIDIKVGEKTKIQKKEIKKWQIERLRKAEKESATSKMLVIMMDDEKTELAFVNQFSIQKKASINAQKQGKMFKEEKSNYFDKVLEEIIRLAPKKVLVAGPGFTKENFKKFVEDKKIAGFPKIILESLNSVGETGFRELISQGKLDSIEKELQLTKESKLIEEVLLCVAKEKAEYGQKEILNAINNGMVSKLILSETFLMENRNKAEEIMNIADKFNCEVHIISSKNPQEKTIHNFGGAIALLHYRK